MYDDTAMEISESKELEAGAAMIAIAAMTGDTYSTVVINDAILSVALDHLDEVVSYLQNPD